MGGATPTLLLWAFNGCVDSVRGRAGSTLRHVAQPRRTRALVEPHAEFAAEQVLQPGDRRRVHAADGGNIGLEPLAGREAVALEHALGHLEVLGILGHGLDRLPESGAPRGWRVAVEHEDLAAVADRARHGLIGFPFRPRRLHAMNVAIDLADR